MSLIIEALKRARDDAIRRQAASKGLPLAPVPRMRGRSRWLALAILPLAAALIVCILLLIDLYSRIPEPTEPLGNSSLAASLPDSAGESAATSSPVVETPPNVSPALGAAVDDQHAAPPQSSPSPSVRTDSPATDTPVEREVTPAAPESLTPLPARPKPQSQPQREATAPPDAREFVGQAQLLDGQLVDLEGIAWSESEPFALLNGQVVGVGEWIRAYRVTEIRRDRVVLEQGDDRVVLRLQ